MLLARDAIGRRASHSPLRRAPPPPTLGGARGVRVARAPRACWRNAAARVASVHGTSPARACHVSLCIGGPGPVPPARHARGNRAVHPAQIGAAHAHRPPRPERRCRTPLQQVGVHVVHVAGPALPLRVLPACWPSARGILTRAAHASVFDTSIGVHSCVFCVQGLMTVWPRGTNAPCRRLHSPTLARRAPLMSSAAGSPPPVHG